MHQILLVSGTRPEIIKLAPVYHALRASSAASVRWLHTGQHGEMADQILASFDIVPDIALSRCGRTLTDFSLGCRQQLETRLAQQRWSAVVVQGDTESAFLGALSAFYAGIPVAHVEAGLRTHDLRRPFPEEGLRQMIARITRLHFAPTARACATLRDEGIPHEAIFLTSNTVVDAQRWMREHKGIRRRAHGRGHLLVTVHRRENWGHDVAAIFRAVGDIAGRHPDLDVLFPVHLNPVIQMPACELLGHRPNVHLVAPLDYPAMQQALADAWLVLTDSGGLQEEAPTFRVPVLVLRHETERPEAIDAGCAAIVGTERQVIVDAVEHLWNDGEAYARMQHGGLPFGDGVASRQIVSILHEQLTLRVPIPIAAA